jgi:hypothetical protein
MFAAVRGVATLAIPERSPLAWFLLALEMACATMADKFMAQMREIWGYNMLNIVAGMRVIR